MKKLKMFALSLTLFSFMAACGGEGTDVVESGTYQGTIDKVEADEKEIYVKTADDKLLELYFTDSTTLTKGGSPVPFDQLQQGGKVEVQVTKTGKRLDPVSVTILE